MAAASYEAQLLELEAKQSSSPVEKQASNIPINSLFNLTGNQLKSLPSFQHATSDTPLRTSNVEDRKPNIMAPRTTMVTMPSAANLNSSPPPMRPLSTASRPSLGSTSRPKQPRKSRASAGKRASGAKRSRSDSMGGDDPDYDENGADEDSDSENIHAMTEDQSGLQHHHSTGDMMPPPLPVDLSHMSMDEQPNSHLINPLPPLNFPVHNHSFVASAGFIVERPDKNNITRRYVHYRCAFCGKDTNDKSRHSKHELACSRGAAKSANKPPKKAKTRQPEVRGNTIIYPSRPPMIMDANGNLSVAGVVHQPLAAPLNQPPSLPSSSMVPTLPPVGSTLSFEPTLANDHGVNQHGMNQHGMLNQQMMNQQGMMNHQMMHQQGGPSPTQQQTDASLVDGNQSINQA